MKRLRQFIEDKNKLFCIDVDDILFATTDRWIYLINNDKECSDILKSKNKYPLEIEHWDDWDFLPNLIGDLAFKFHNDSSLYDEFDLVIDAQKFIKTLISTVGLKRIRFVTASEENNINIKDKLLLQYFDLPANQIIHILDKEKYYAGNFILDDAAHNHEKLLHREDTLCVMLDYSWNNHFQHPNLNRVHSLEELIKEFKK